MPLNRWVDLWLRCFLLSIGQPEQVSKTVDGKLYPYSVQLFTHQSFATVTFYAILESNQDQFDFVKIEISRYTIDMFTDKEIWSQFQKDHDFLFTALDQQQIINIKKGTLDSTGHLQVYDSQLSSSKYDLRQIMKKTSKIPSFKLLGIDRHPLQFRQLILITDPDKVTAQSIQLKDQKIPINFDKIPGNLNQITKHLKKFDLLIIELRFDSNWYSIPLAVQIGPAVIFPGYDPTSRLESNSAYAILKERSSKVLRA